MSEVSYTRRQRHLRNLVVMAVADGSLGQREVNLLADRCVELGLGQADLEAALRAGMKDDAALELPSQDADRVACLKDLIRMMAADGNLDESEKRLFALAAAKMNIAGDRLTAIIADAADDSADDSMGAT